MEVRNKKSALEQIKELSYIVEGNSFKLRWRWPTNIDMVYIYRSETKDTIPIESISRKNSRLITKDEFVGPLNKEFVDKINNAANLTYIIYPCVVKKGKKFLIRQNNKDNRIKINTRSNLVHYSIKQNMNFSKNKKLLTINIISDFVLEKERLRYVVKKNLPPTDLDDGSVIFPFREDVKVGENIIRNIRIDKNEYVDVFLINQTKEETDIRLIRKI